MAKIVWIEAARCFCCDTIICAIEPVDDTPELGTVPLNVTVCACCGHLMIVEHDLTLREPTPNELRMPSIRTLSPSYEARSIE
jgi:hypothetical protein